MNQQTMGADEQVICQPTGNRRRILWTLLLCLVLVLTTVIAFEQVRHNQFVYDDLLYISENPYMVDGLTVDSIKWAFTTTCAGNWHPVTWLSHMLDCQIYGLNPLGHHITNLLIHIVNSLLVFFLLSRMTGAFWRSFFVAAVFALHPIHVESVVWAAERKDLLCGLFWLLTIAAYVRYSRKPSPGRYIPVVIVFVLGLLSKPMMVTLPFVLLLLDYWPLARMAQLQPSGAIGRCQSDEVNSRYKKASIWFLVVEKLPLFVLVIISSIVTFIAQQGRGAMDMFEHLALDVRMANAITSYTTYIGKIIYPGDLAVLYPHPGENFALWHVLVSLGIVLLVTIMAFLLGRLKPYFFLGWLWFIGTLLPVIGLVQIGAHSIADRYTYLPSIGFFIMVTWGVAEFAGERKFLKVGLGISAVIIIALLTIGTRKQVKYWRDSFTLYERALAVTSDNPVMLYNMGVALQKERQFDRAIRCYREALIILPDCSQAYNNLGLVLVEQGDLEEAIINFQQAVEHMHSFVDARQNLAVALQSSGKYDEAINHYREILRQDSDHVVSLNALARILIAHPVQERRNPAEAVLLAERAAKLTEYKRPDILETLAAAYAAKGQFDGAIITIQMAINLAQAANDDRLVGYLNQQLQMYKQGIFRR